MPYYKDKDNRVRFIDSADFEILIPDSCVPISDAEALMLQSTNMRTAENINDAVTAARSAAYVQESDPLFFKYQRGEVHKEDWLAKVAEIKARYPDGVLPVYTATP